MVIASKDAITWRHQRRPEILKLFEENVYGKAAGKPKDMTVDTKSVSGDALGGKATPKKVVVYFAGKKDGPQMEILNYLPNNAKKSVPAFLGLNFCGSQSIYTDPGITLSKQWMRSKAEFGIMFLPKNSNAPKAKTFFK